MIWNNEGMDKANNPQNLPNPGDRIIFWDPKLNDRVCATIMTMTNKQQARWPGFRNILVDNKRIQTSVNLDSVSLNCVGWRFIDNVPQVDGNYTEQNMTQSTQHTPAQSGSESVKTMEWDNYASDPSYISPPLQQDWTMRDQRRHSRDKVKTSLESARDYTQDYNLRPRTLSFLDVDALDISSNASWYGEVFDLHPDDEQVANVHTSVLDVDDPPPVPPRSQRSQSVIVCSSRTCKPTRISDVLEITDRLSKKYGSSPHY